MVSVPCAGAPRGPPRPALATSPLDVVTFNIIIQEFGNTLTSSAECIMICKLFERSLSNNLL